MAADNEFEKKQHFFTNGKTQHFIILFAVSIILDYWR